MNKFDKAADFLADLLERGGIAELVADHEVMIEFLAAVLREPNVWTPDRLKWTDDIILNEEKVEYGLQVLFMLLISSSTTDQQVSSNKRIETAQKSITNPLFF